MRLLHTRAQNFISKLHGQHHGLEAPEESHSSNTRCNCPSTVLHMPSQSQSCDLRKMSKIEKTPHSKKTTHDAMRSRKVLRMPLSASLLLASEHAMDLKSSV